tara:strand:- start:40 stop:369 length:330 start_codon:yes stop_codon:yes gene_type:complete
MSHPGNDQIIDAMRDEMTEKLVEKELAKRLEDLKLTKVPNLTPDQIGRLNYLIDAYGRDQHSLGQLNMINKSDRGSAFYDLHAEYRQDSRDARTEITEIIEILISLAVS